jgi:transketolase
MPSWEIFNEQTDAYRQGVLPKAVRKRVTVEAGSPMGWHQWAGDEGTIIAINRFGGSAPGEEVMKHLGFTVEHVVSAALRLVGRNAEADREYGSETAMAPTGAADGHS